jgi:hypothetical protein
MEATLNQGIVVTITLTHTEAITIKKVLGGVIPADLMNTRASYDDSVTTLKLYDVITDALDGINTTTI